MKAPVVDHQSTVQILQILSRARLLSENVLDKISICFFIVNQNGSIYRVSDSAAKLINIDKEWILGVSLEKLFSAENWQKFRKEMDDVLNNFGSPPQKEFELSIKNDASRSYFWEISPYTIDATFGQKLLTILGRDISELKATLKRNELAEAASAAKSQFLAHTSHEIRNPLSSIIGMAELLLDTEVTANQKKCLTHLHNAGLSLLTLLNDILDLSKIESGVLELEKVEFELEEVIRRVSELFIIRAQKKDLQLIFDISPEVPESLIGDPNRLRQILVNLVGNALKFTSQGEVSLKVEIETLTHPGALGSLLFSVQDSGIGISPDEMTNLFKAFNQADASIANKFGGTGLGLTISRNLINLLGGDIWVESKKGIGSKFLFRIPMITPPPQQDKDKVDDTLKLNGMSFLILTSNLSIRKILTQNLTSWSSTTTVTADLLNALEMIKNKNKTGSLFNIIFIDSDILPLEDINVIHSLINKLGANPPIIISLVSVIQSDKSGSSHGNNLIHFLEKPIWRSDLKKLLLNILSHNQLAIVKVKNQSLELENQFKTLDKFRIILADDSEDSRSLILSYLKQIQITVDVAEDGEKAVELVKTGKYDLIFMDMEMPVMDGLTATRNIRKWELESKRKPIPLLALTGNASKEEGEKCINAGFSAHISKPIRKGDFLKVLLDFLENS